MNWLLLKNSMLVSISTTAGAMVVGMCVAIWFSGLERRWRNLVFALAIVSLMWPPFLVTNCWLDLLGHSGSWRSWLPLDIYSFGGTVWILTLMLWPVTFLLVTSAWRQLEPAHLEVDPLLRGVALLRWLLLPMARPALVTGGVLTFVLALSNFAVPAILQVKVFPAEVWFHFNTTFDYATALQLSWPLVIVPLFLLFLLRQQHVRWMWKQNAIPPGSFRRQFGARPFAASGVIAMVAFALSVAIPLVQLCFSTATWTNFLPALQAGQSALMNSVLFAAVSATCVVGFAVLLAIRRLVGASDAPRRDDGLARVARAGISVLPWIFFLVPGVLLGIVLIWSFNRAPVSWFYQSIGIVIVAFTVRYFALGSSVVGDALRSTDRNLADVAQMEGATRWQILRHVELPQILPHACVAWYIVYLLCLWDVETLILIVPPGSQTVALRIFNLLHYGYAGQVNALCLLLLAAAVLPLVAGVIWKSNRRVFARLAVVAVVLPLFSGCSGSNGGNIDRAVAVQSKFFSHVEVIGSRGTGSGQFNKPRSLALDTNDFLYVVDMTGRVQKFSPEGAFVLSWQMPQTDKGRPKGMGRDAAGNIIVIEPHYSRVNHFSPDGTLKLQWGEHGTNRGRIAFPRAVAVNSAGDLFICEYGVVERAQRFNPIGQFIHSFGSAGTGAGEFNRIEGLSMDANDCLYAADSCNHRIQVFDGEGKFLRQYGKAGSGAGELSYPYDIRVERSGFQFVCEFGNSRIQIFDEKDQPVETLGGAGAEPGQFANPWSIALDSKGNLYVADSQNHRVQKFIRKRA